MDSSFGARLKAQRERQHVTLETIVAHTKIRLHLLDELERDDMSRWPMGIYRRSYLRSYAASIGLDPEATVREFLALYPDIVEDPEPTLATNAELERAGRRPPMRLQYLIASAIGALPQAFSQKGRKAAPEAAVQAAGAQSTLNTTHEPTDEERNGGLDEEFELTPPDDVVEADAPFDVDLPAMAHLCTRLAQASSASDLERLLEEASRILRAVGIIVWPWDPARSVLWPSLSHGYSRQTLAMLPTLTRDAENPIGAAFRSSALQVIGDGGTATSALVVPLMTPGGCAGVLALECASGLEREPALHALAIILAAQLSLLVTAEPLARTAIA